MRTTPYARLFSLLPVRANVMLPQGYEDEAEDPVDDEEEDASYADEEYGAPKKKAPKKKKAPSKPRGTSLPPSRLCS